MVDSKEQHLDRVFYALSDQTRRKMLLRLSTESLNLKELGEPFGISKQAISKHIQVLDKAGLISKSKDGRIKLCKFNPESLEKAEAVLERYRTFWNQQLDGLDEYIENIKSVATKKK